MEGGRLRLTHRPLAVAAAAAFVLAATGVLALRATHAVGEPNQMAVDADPTIAGIQTTRTISGTGAFSIGVDITQANTPYQGYQVELTYPFTGMQYNGTVTYNSSDGMALCQSGSASNDGTTGQPRRTAT